MRRVGIARCPSGGGDARQPQCRGTPRLVSAVRYRRAGPESQELSRNFAGFFKEAVVGIRFGSFVFYLDTRQLTREGVEIHLTPKAFELLAVLVEDRPKVVSKAALLERLWPGTFVAEANVSNLVAEIRGALDDRLRKPRWVRTVHGLGYAFCGDAITLGRPESAAVDRPMCWLEWGQRRFPLLIGEHVVGRIQMSRSGSTRRRCLGGMPGWW